MNACPHPSIPTLARPHIAAGHKNEYLIVFEESIHVPDPRVKVNDLAGQRDSTRIKPASHGSIGRWRVEWGRVRRFQHLAGRVGPGRARRVSNLTGRVGSGRVGSAVF